MRRNALSKGAELGPPLAVLQLQGTESCQAPSDLVGGFFHFGDSRKAGGLLTLQCHLCETEAGTQLHHDRLLPKKLRAKKSGWL